MEALIIDDIVVTINKNFKYRITDHPAGEYHRATLALNVPQSMNSETLIEWLDKNEVALKRYKANYVDSLNTNKL